MDDRTLLVAFVDWLDVHATTCEHQMIQVEMDDIDAFLASRQPPGEPCDDASIAAARAWVVGDDGVETFSVLIQDTLERALDALARESGLATAPDGPLVTLMVPTRVRLTPPAELVSAVPHASPYEETRPSPKPPAPQRFWTVDPYPTGTWWYASIVSDGQATLIMPGRPTRAEAEADGRDSGLPEWPGEQR